MVIQTTTEDSRGQIEIIDGEREHTENRLVISEDQSHGTNGGRNGGWGGLGSEYRRVDLEKHELIFNNNEYFQKVDAHAALADSRSASNREWTRTVIILSI